MSNMELLNIETSHWVRSDLGPVGAAYGGPGRTDALSVVLTAHACTLTLVQLCTPSSSTFFFFINVLFYVDNGNSFIFIFYTGIS